MVEGVEFEEEQYASVRPFAHAGQEQQGGLIGLLMRTGAAKDERQANIILLAVAGVAVLATIVVIVMGFGGDSNNVPTRPIPAAASNF